ncbi:hypothetical protein KGY73_00060 [bacterium]|nr:hypothetical protein [bacterium]
MFERKGRLVLSFLFSFIFIFHLGLFSQGLQKKHIENLEMRTIGPAVMSGRIVDLAVVEKDPYIFYVASATGGLWKTTNNGVTFEPVFQNQGTHSIGDVVVHQDETNIIWVGTGERANRQSSSWGDGLYKSMDGGKSWTHMGLSETHHIGRIVLHPEDPNKVYVAAMGHLWGPNKERGLYRSEDGGKSWEKVLYIDEDTGVVDVAVDPSQPNILYAAAYQRRRRPFGFHGGGPGSGLYKSTDGGDSWKELTQGLPEGDKGRIGISIYRKDPRIIYVCVEQGYRYNASTAYHERRAGIYRSEDRGENWKHMSDWNPRPMYASQILVDPNDDQRIYMENRFSYSVDGGKTFKSPNQSLHGDDRILWVNPNDSRHLIKGDDGGVGISYDQGKTWLYITSLPVSQFYRVSVDMRKPYWVYGGLQDNGSWAGPSATYRRSGILNEDWIKTGGGDGFVNLINPEDKNTLYVESQYLGLSRLDLESREDRSIRPGDPHGHIRARRNWDAWGPGLPEPELGNAMAPANWDAPFVVSHHNPQTIYAGTNKLWKSSDGGYTWSSLGNLTTGINRRDLRIMGQRAKETTPSLDDGIPYYPTLTAIAESPLKQGLLYVGTDDGNLQVSRDDGKTWKNVSGQLPDFPQNGWIADIEASRFDEGTVYVVVNNYRNDDYKNYLYKSSDFGESWTSLVGDLPPERVLRRIREDTRNPELLFVGAELGMYFSIDGGNHWVELENNMPTAAFNDMVIHPRDNDLVMATHGRGIWILDNIACLQELNEKVLASRAHLFSIEPAEMIRYTREKGHTGDMIFRGENPPRGAVIDYYLKEKESEEDVRLDILDTQGSKIVGLKPSTKKGINRVVWDLRHSDIKGPLLDKNSDEEDRRTFSGPLVIPGLYKARLQVGEVIEEKTFRVKEDPRIQQPMDTRKEWTQTLLSIAELYENSSPGVEAFHKVKKKVDEISSDAIEDSVKENIEEMDRKYKELNQRIATLYYEVSGWTGRMTGDQQSQMDYYRQMLEKLEKSRKELFHETLPRINKNLPPDQRIQIKKR